MAGVKALVGLLTTLALAVAAEPFNVPWTTLLPGPAGGKGGPQPRCRKATLSCLSTVIRRLRARQDHFGCDHRAVFATTYLTLTRVMRRTMRADRHFFHDRRAILFEDALFAAIYFRTLKRFRLGRSVDPAWRIALENAAGGDLQGAGDMLLGINAHVQNDMPFLLAAITLLDREGRSRKPDHDAENRILDDAFGAVVRRVSGRYDPLTALERHDLSPATDVFAIELVKAWREGVWRNAERLVNARTAAQRRSVADTIREQAGATAQLIVVATQGPPGYRATRDAHCAEQAAAR